VVKDEEGNVVGNAEAGTLFPYSETFEKCLRGSEALKILSNSRSRQY